MWKDIERDPDEEFAELCSDEHSDFDTYQDPERGFVRGLMDAIDYEWEHVQREKKDEEERLRKEKADKIINQDFLGLNIKWLLDYYEESGYSLERYANVSPSYLQTLSNPSSRFVAKAAEFLNSSMDALVNTYLEEREIIDCESKDVYLKRLTKYTSNGALDWKVVKREVICDRNSMHPLSERVDWKEKKTEMFERGYRALRYPEYANLAECVFQLSTEFGDLYLIPLYYDDFLGSDIPSRRYYNEYENVYENDITPLELVAVIGSQKLPIYSSLELFGERRTLLNDLLEAIRQYLEADETDIPDKVKNSLDDTKYDNLYGRYGVHANFSDEDIPF